MKIPSKQQAPMVRLSGERSKLMPKVVQNHQADSSLIFPMCSLSYTLRKVLSTVYRDIPSSVATSFCDAPQAIRSATSLSRSVKIAVVP